MITSLGEERELVCVLLVHLFVYFARVNFCPFSLPLGVGLAAACDCGTPWTILLTFFSDGRVRLSLLKTCLCFFFFFLILYWYGLSLTKWDIKENMSWVDEAIWDIWAATWQNQQCECAPSEDSDQPWHPPSLIRVFAVRMKKPCVLSYPLSGQRRLWSDWAEARADQSLRWAHPHFIDFVMSRFINSYHKRPSSITCMPVCISILHIYSVKNMRIRDEEETLAARTQS